jgi:hypothetical protein
MEQSPSWESKVRFTSEGFLRSENIEKHVEVRLMNALEAVSYMLWL